MTTSLIVLLGLVAAAFVWVAAARSVQRNHGRLRLHDVVRIQGLVVPDTEAALRTGAFAARRCLWCAAHERCDPLISAKNWTALEQVCPNADYLDNLRRNQFSR